MCSEEHCTALVCLLFVDFITISSPSPIFLVIKTSRRSPRSSLCLRGDTSEPIMLMWLLASVLFLPLSLMPGNFCASQSFLPPLFLLTAPPHWLPAPRGPSLMYSTGSAIIPPVMLESVRKVFHMYCLSSNIRANI